MHPLFQIITVALLVWSSNAQASTWWVQTEYQGKALAQYLTALWPKHDIQVQVGDRAGDGIWYKNGSLHFTRDGFIQEEQLLWDYALMISTVRGWHSTITINDGGWTPEWTPPTVDANLRPETNESTPSQKTPLPTPLLFQAGLAIHTAADGTQSKPSPTLSLEFPFTLGLFRIGPHLGLDVLNKNTAFFTGAESQANVTRWDLMVVASLPLPLSNPFFEPFLKGGYRAYSAAQQMIASETFSPFVPTWSAGLGVRFWVYQNEKVALGISSGVQYDGRTGGIYVAQNYTTPVGFQFMLCLQYGKTKIN